MYNSIAAMSSYKTWNSSIFHRTSINNNSCKIMASHGFYSEVAINICCKTWSHSYNKWCHINFCSKIFFCKYCINNYIKFYLIQYICILVYNECNFFFFPAFINIIGNYLISARITRAYDMVNTI